MRGKITTRNVDEQNFELLESEAKYSKLIYRTGNIDFAVISTTYHHFVHAVYFMLCKVYGGNSIKFKSPLPLQYDYNLYHYRMKDGSYRFPKKDTVLYGHLQTAKLDIVQIMDLYDKLAQVDNRYTFTLDTTTNEYVIALAG